MWRHWLKPDWYTETPAVAGRRPPPADREEGRGGRMTVDVRAVNAQTEATQWPMPLLEVVLDHVQGATVFFGLDFFKG